MMKLLRLVLFGLMCAIAASAFTAHAQEKDPSYPRTGSWQLGAFMTPDGSNIQAGEVIVFDTAGVCLYIVTGRITGGPGGSSGQLHSIAAVPKTQLPKGAGCQ